jgi:hypothetical protein
MNTNDNRQSTLLRLDSTDLRDATRWVGAKWLEKFAGGNDRGGVDLAEFGVLEPYLAEAIVIERGSDFLFMKWGAALDMLCGGNRRGHKLSALPQPSRAQLRRVCVRAVADQLPQASHATWAIEGRIWQCAMLGLPTEGDELSATRLLVALLFAPHPKFTARFDTRRKQLRRSIAPRLTARGISPNP